MSERTVGQVTVRLATMKACAECHEEVEQKGFPPRPDCRFCVHDYRLALVEEREARERAEARVAELEGELAGRRMLAKDTQDLIAAQARRIAELEGAAEADEQRLIAAAEKAGIGFGGCDTPDDLAEAALDLAGTAVDLRASQRQAWATCAAYREALGTIAAPDTEDEHEGSFVVALGSKLTREQCREIARLNLASPDPARAVTERLEAAAKMADAARVWARISLNWSFQRPDRVDALLEADKSICVASAAYDKAVGRDA